MKHILFKFCVTLFSGLMLITQLNANVIVAIDAGHGGKDSGAIGQNKVYEKNITLSISKKLKKIMDKDKNIKAILTRSDDSFISVADRSDIARRNKADLLVSIHADAAPNKNAKGASIWVLSTKRADTELGRWIEQHEKQSELLGGAGKVLSDADDDNPFLSQAILDLQFSHSQQVGYKLALEVIAEMKKDLPIHKNKPAHASLGVLRSPDIPSILIEIGFISNIQEEKQLANDAYQNKIALAIYKGIKNYIKNNPISRGAP